MLRTLRIISASIFALATIAFIVAGNRLSWLNAVPAMQFTPSSLVLSLSLSTMGVALVWIAVTYLFGRVYCSTVCPIGFFQDLLIALKRKIKPGKPFRYKLPNNKIRYNILLVYVITLIVGIWAVPLLLEPWNMLRNITFALSLTPMQQAWTAVGVSSLVVVIAGLVTILGIIVYSIFSGRDFCNTICPVGSAMSLVRDSSLYIIAINPDRCTNCLKCEEACKAACIKIVSRLVDNSRCIRCFDCIDVCPNQAVSFTRNRHRPASPLFRRVSKPSV